MRVTKESTVTRQITAYLKTLKQAGEPIWFTKLHGGPMQQAGLPDLIVLYRGRLFAVEIKRPGGKATQLQLHTLAEMQKAGATVCVARSVDDVRTLIEETMQQRRLRPLEAPSVHCHQAAGAASVHYFTP